MDYFVVSECLSQAWAIVATCVIGDQTFGPHSPVRLIVKANSRTVMVRQLKVPVGFSADLPFGPMPQTGCPRVLCETGAKKDARNAITYPNGEDGGLIKNARGGCSTGALCYCSPYPLPAMSTGGDNFDNNDARPRVGLGRNEEGDLAGNTRDGCSTGALC